MAQPPPLETGGARVDETGPAARAGMEADGQVRFHLHLILVYIFSAFAFQLMLLVPLLSRARMPLRMLPFAASLALALFPPKKLVPHHRLHPALGAAILVMIILAFGFINQETDSFLAASASVVFYAAILAPLLWVGRLLISQRGLVTIVLVMWSINSLSSAVGVLQVMFPGHFVGAMSQVVQKEEEDQGVDLKIELANGQHTYRPFGLTDQPGGVAPSGIIAFTFGLGLLSITRRPAMLLLYAAGMAAGLFVIYLCQVRMALVTCGIATVGYVALLIWRAQFVQVSRVVTATVLVVGISTGAALYVGGAQVTDRVLTLVASNAGSVYYSNRGAFLEYTFDYVLPEWPLGAGLGRYGMINSYFNTSLKNAPLWSEIQWTAWAYDGGWLMVMAYPLALLIAIGLMLYITLDKDAGPIGPWATLIAAYDISSFAVTFSYALFISEGGLAFWMLNALVFSVYQVHKRQIKTEIPEGFEVVPERWRPGEAGGVVLNAIRQPVIEATPMTFGPRRRALGARPLPSVPILFQSGTSESQPGASRHDGEPA